MTGISVKTQTIIGLIFLIILEVIVIDLTHKYTPPVGPVFALCVCLVALYLVVTDYKIIR
jgi:hypothetical protein